MLIVDLHEHLEGISLAYPRLLKSTLMKSSIRSHVNHENEAIILLIIVTVI